MRRIVEEEHLGKLVYAGGDDVLAFVNLKDLFGVMRKLRASFSGQIKIKDGAIDVCWENESGFVERGLLSDNGKECHRLCGAVRLVQDPLKLVLDKVKEMERIKHHGERTPLV